MAPTALCEYLNKVTFQVILVNICLDFAISIVRKSAPRS